MADEAKKDLSRDGGAKAEVPEKFKSLVESIDKLSALELSEVGANKIAVIKVVREVTGKGLKEAKDLVDGAPKVVKENAPKAEAEEIKKKIEEAGGKVALK